MFILITATSSTNLICFRRKYQESVKIAEYLFYQLIIIIIITLFESQIILAEHECCTNWGDCKSNKSNQIKCWFLRRGENRSSRRKTSRSRVENQQTQPTYDAGSGNRTRDTLVEGERSHHYTNPAPRLLKIHNALSNPNIDVRILAQGYCVVIVSLSLV